MARVSFFAVVLNGNAEKDEKEHGPYPCDWQTEGDDGSCRARGAPSTAH